MGVQGYPGGQNSQGVGNCPARELKPVEVPGYTVCAAWCVPVRKLPMTRERPPKRAKGSSVWSGNQ